MPDQLYQDLIMDRVRHPKHAGRPAVFDAQAEGSNPLCGDQIKLFLKHDGTEIHHESQGCAIMVASAELMADALAGASFERIRQCRSAFEAVVNTGAEDPSIGSLNALANVSEYRSRIRCATLPWTALFQALEGAE